MIMVFFVMPNMMETHLMDLRRNANIIIILPVPSQIYHIGTVWTSVYKSGQVSTNLDNSG